MQVSLGERATSRLVLQARRPPHMVSSVFSRFFAFHKRCCCNCCTERPVCACLTLVLQQKRVEKRKNNGVSDDRWSAVVRETVAKSVVVAYI